MISFQWAWFVWQVVKVPAVGPRDQCDARTVVTMFAEITAQDDGIDPIRVRLRQRIL